jgi:hypothetical protein
MTLLRSQVGFSGFSDATFILMLPSEPCLCSKELKRILLGAGDHETAESDFGFVYMRRKLNGELAEMELKSWETDWSNV